LSSDGRHVLSGSRDGTLRWWDLHSEQPVRALLGHTGPPVKALALSSDGRFALSASHDGYAGETWRWWDLYSGQARRLRTWRLAFGEVSRLVEHIRHSAYN